MRPESFPNPPWLFSVWLPLDMLSPMVALMLPGLELHCQVHQKENISFPTILSKAWLAGWGHMTIPEPIMIAENTAIL